MVLQPQQRPDGAIDEDFVGDGMPAAKVPRTAPHEPMTDVMDAAELLDGAYQIVIVLLLPNLLLEEARGQ